MNGNRTKTPLQRLLEPTDDDAGPTMRFRIEFGPDGEVQSSRETFHSGARILAQRFELGEVLWQGTMSSGYAALDRSAGTTVVVKVRGQHTGEAEAVSRARFLREANIMSRIDCPHVVRFVTHGTEPDGTQFIAMQRLVGPTVRQLIMRRGTLHELTLLEIGIQAACALDNVHLRGIVHRDVKPANIIVGRSVRGGMLVSLIDFGISAFLHMGDHTLSAEGQTVLTPAFASPEQLFGGRADARSDLHALGLVLYAMAAGTPAPIERPPLETVSAATRMIIEKCLETMPSKRWASAKELMSALKSRRRELIEQDAPGEVRRSGVQRIDASQDTGPLTFDDEQVTMKRSV